MSTASVAQAPGRCASNHVAFVLGPHAESPHSPRTFDAPHVLLAERVDIFARQPYVGSYPVAVPGRCARSTEIVVRNPFAGPEDIHIHRSGAVFGLARSCKLLGPNWAQPVLTSSPRGRSLYIYTCKIEQGRKLARTCVCVCPPAQHHCLDSGSGGQRGRG